MPLEITSQNGGGGFTTALGIALDGYPRGAVLVPQVVKMLGGYAGLLGRPQLGRVSVPDRPGGPSGTIKFSGSKYVVPKRTSISRCDMFTRHRLGYWRTLNPPPPGLFLYPPQPGGGGGGGSDPPAISKTDGRRETDEAAFERSRRDASKLLSII